MSKISSDSVGFLGLLTLLFIGLKLCRVIDWSWWWVLAPAWMPMGLVASLSLLAAALHAADRPRRRRPR